MKKRLYLSIILGLSTLATLGRAYSAFFASLKELPNHLTGDAKIDSVLLEVTTVAEKQYEFTTNNFNKLLILMMFVTLLASLFYLTKKKMRAVYCYLVYLSLTLINAIYSFVMLGSLSHIYSDGSMRSTYLTGVRMRFIFSVGLLIIYLLILYVNNRNQSTDKSFSSAGIDL